MSALASGLLEDALFTIQCGSDYSSSRDCRIRLWHCVNIQCNRICVASVSSLASSAKILAEPVSIHTFTKRKTFVFFTIQYSFSI